MKFKLFSLTVLLIALSVFSAHKVSADVAYSQEINLSPDWNLVSTPRILESHTFSSPENSDNFDIYVLDASSNSGWSTLSDLGQITFAPLFGYFINNKTGSTATLTFNYKADVPPNERLFERIFGVAGWYSFGIANPTYAKTIDADSTDTNNPSHILNSLRAVTESTSGGHYNSVVDLTYSLGDVNSVAVGDTWNEAVHYEVNTLDDFREMKAYAIYINTAQAQYTGFQNNDIPACSDGIDNDEDGLVDMDDPGCTNPLDNDETDPVSATVVISLNSSTPVATQVIASEGVDENEKDGVELLRINFGAEGNEVTITDLIATITRGGDTSTATSSTAYLYDGGTLIGSASVVGTSSTAMTATFSDIDWVVPVDTTKVLTLKVDIQDAGTTATTFSASVATTGVVASNVSEDDISGSATGNVITVSNIGPEITLVSKSIAKTSAGFAGATSTAQSSFSINLKAVGGDLHFGPQASSTFAFDVYKNGVVEILFVASSTSWSIPSGVVTSGVTSGGFILQEGNTVTVPVDFIFEGRESDGSLIATDSYAIGLRHINWNTGGVDSITSNFMSGNIGWRTSTVVMP